jgi:plastocyanin
MDTRSSHISPLVAVALFGAALAVAAVALFAVVASETVGVAIGAVGGMMGGGSGPGSGGMMGSGPWDRGVQPGAPGILAGTVAAPRVVRITAGPGFAFSPSAIIVTAGETVTFVVTTMGPTTHEFMVGPADAVAADVEGTPEVGDIGMMQAKSVTYTFDGPGQFAFACHATGHYEAGMRGTIVVVPQPHARPTSDGGLD